MSAIIEPYGHTASGEAVHRIRLEADIAATILSFGGIVETLHVPDRAGQRANVVLGLDTLDGYATRSPHFGATTGRYAGRIAGAAFTLDGVRYPLAANSGVNAIHGGPNSFSKKAWTIESSSRTSVLLSYLSLDGEEGFPGALRVTVGFSVAGGALRIEYQAETDRPTVLNLTNHSYFNLGGEGSGDIMDHVLQVPADRFLPMRADSIPTGEVWPVEGTPFDFRTPHPIGARIRQADEQILIARGYDHYYVVDGAGFRLAATAWHPGSGRAMRAWTDQPGVHVYSGNNLTGQLAGPSGRAYRPGDALCLETQHYPDSPNQPGFPSTVLRPGEVFRSATEYVFSAEDGQARLGVGGWLG